MRLWIPALCFVLGSCTSAPRQEPSVNVVRPKTDYFAGTRGCFVLFDIAENKMVEVINPERCAEETAPCSTFKVPLAVMAFDSGAIKSENDVFKWNKKKNSMPAWNKDQTPESWMHESVVWVSQKLTAKMGKKKVQKYLSDFWYGNEDFSGSLSDAWLTPVPGRLKTKTTVKISAMEQVDFMKKLWKLELPASKESQEITKKILATEDTVNGSILKGKTGSGYSDAKNKKRLGWYVAHVDGKDGREYIAVVTFDDLQPQPQGTHGGFQAKGIMKMILTDKGL